MPAELRFVIGQCSAAPPATAPPGLDWAIVAQGLERHGLTRLIPAMLTTPGLVPPEAVAPLQDLHRAQAASALAQVGETVRLAALLDEARVRFVLVKGRALAIQLFGRPDARPSKDIDVLVEPGAGPRVDSILRALGYARSAGDRLKDDLPGFEAKEIGYLNAQRHMMVEVHSRLTENDDLYTTDFETLWAGRDAVPLGGRTLPAMPRDRLATYLCVHGARHCWARLMWLLDIAALTRTPVEVRAALADARAFGLETVMLHSLSLLHHWFGHDVPDDVLREARSRRAVRILDRMAAFYHVDRRWHVQAPLRSWRRFVQNSLVGRVTGYTMKPGFAYWRRQVSLDLVAPADRTIIALPPGLAWLYVPLRPFGWLIRRLRN